ncbi:cysteine hydrolase family protein [Nocardioides mangrovi]|uniref:Cysteine hydrolase n=1 Tax=Nocardioides mangrovi TaxID=2874580 RepID=A0ABS7UES5_9ACTN|nr:cysteine hydrolase [Nocardioides mangrovi]MBZ5739372.1 cysteine hydrolase [Nocardioides mangrovi]
MPQEFSPLQVLDWTPSADLTPVGEVVLVVLDVAPGPDHDAQVARVEALVAGCRDAGVPVVFARTMTGPAASVPAAPGLADRPEEYVVRRHRHSAFYGTELDLVVHGYGAQTVLLAGGTTDVSVHYSLVDAHQLDHHIRCVADLVTGTNPELHEAALRAIKYLQRDALVTTAAVETWLAGRRTPEEQTA